MCTFVLKFEIGFLSLRRLLPPLPQPTATLNRSFRRGKLHPKFRLLLLRPASLPVYVQSVLLFAHLLFMSCADSDPSVVVVIVYDCRQLARTIPNASARCNSQYVFQFQFSFAPVLSYNVVVFTIVAAPSCSTIGSETSANRAMLDTLNRTGFLEQGMRCLYHATLFLFTLVLVFKHAWLGSL